MQPLSLSILILLLTTSQLFAQKNDTFNIFYCKDSSSIIKLNDDYKTIFVFSYPKGFEVTEEMPIELTLNGASITVTTKVKKAKGSRTIVFGELPQVLFDTKIKGHIDFGKAMLNEMDSISPDSTITLATKALVDADITGELYLDFRKGYGLSEDFWNEVEYYWLLDREVRIQDSIENLTADIERGKALQAASSIFLESTKEQIQKGEKEISKKHIPFVARLEAIKKINSRIDESFDLVKTGKVLSEQEKNEISYLTADGFKLKKEIKKENGGEDALKVFKTVSKAYSQQKVAQKQYDSSTVILREAEANLEVNKAEATRIKKRLKTLKKILKL
jgi:hypothetical protein